MVEMMGSDVIISGLLVILLVLAMGIMVLASELKDARHRIDYWQEKYLDEIEEMDENCFYEDSPYGNKVAEYADEEAARKGHKKWITKMTTKELPKSLKSIQTGEKYKLKI
jgi:hypothetical protein